MFEFAFPATDFPEFDNFECCRLGKYVKSGFRHRTFLDFDTDRFQRYYDEQFEKGKTVAKDIQKKKEEEGGVEEDEVEYGDAKEVKESKPKSDPNSAIVRKLKELAELREMGVIDDEEFAQMKGRLIENYK